MHLILKIGEFGIVFDTSMQVFNDIADSLKIVGVSLKACSRHVQGAQVFFLCCTPNINLMEGLV